MDAESVTLDELAERLRFTIPPDPPLRHETNRQIAVMRAVLGPDGRLLAATVVVGPNPLSRVERRWIYKWVRFVSGTIAARRLASVFSAGESKDLEFAGEKISVQFTPGNFMRESRPSLAQYDKLSLAWPSVTYKPHLANQPNVYIPGYLVGLREAPSFPTFGAAFNAFMYDDYSVSGTGNPELGEVSVRFVDQRARIYRVRIRAASVDVWVGGTSLDECYLELNGVEHRQVIQIGKPRRVSFPLPQGLPSDAWLWLKDGPEWLDYRALNGWGNYRSADVEDQLPRDLGAEISRLAAQGEGQHIEYKAKLPETRDEKRHVFKTAVAFACGEGGTILFGIGDGGKIIGLTGTLQDARARLTDLLRDLITPPPETVIESHRHEGKNILLLRVQPGAGIIYALTIDKNKPEYYVRRDGTTFFAQPEEIAAIVRRGEPTRPSWLGYA